MTRHFARILIGMLACLFMQVWPLAGASLVQAHPYHHHHAPHHTMGLCQQPMQAECTLSPAPLPAQPAHGHEKCCTTHASLTDSAAPVAVVLPAAPLGKAGLRFIPRTATGLAGTDCLPARRPPKIQAV